MGLSGPFFIFTFPGLEQIQMSAFPLAVEFVCEEKRLKIPVNELADNRKLLEL